MSINYTILMEIPINLLLHRLQSAPGRFSFTTDCWTSPNQIAFMGITVHWISADWQLKNLVLDFIPLSGPHFGENLAMTFKDTLVRYNILDKVRFIIANIVSFRSQRCVVVYLEDDKYLLILC